MLPYSIESKINCVSLYPLDDGRFQMMAQGNLSPFMDSYEYALVENKLADFLDSLNISHIEFKDAIIWNRLTNEEFRGYKQLIFRTDIAKPFRRGKMHKLNLKGIQVYLCESGYLYVSPKLKELLENAGFDYLLFEQGGIRFYG